MSLITGFAPSELMKDEAMMLTLVELLPGSDQPQQAPAATQV